MNEQQKNTLPLERINNVSDCSEEKMLENNLKIKQRLLQCTSIDAERKAKAPKKGPNKRDSILDKIDEYRQLANSFNVQKKLSKKKY
jgi:hypothetical protein